MTDHKVNEPPTGWGTYEDARALANWSFLQKTPEQRLDWLIGVLEIAYASGALEPHRPIRAEVPAVIK